jgi:hypothetical protein
MQPSSSAVWMTLSEKILASMVCSLINNIFLFKALPLGELARKRLRGQAA